MSGTVKVEPDSTPIQAQFTFLAPSSHGSASSPLTTTSPAAKQFRFNTMDSWPNSDTLLSFNEDFDDVGDLPNPPGPSSSVSIEKTIKRRASKACDACRRSKSRCARPSPNEPCTGCSALGIACTFGPSKKRGPPKGYIDAIEARLHQTEALIGILLASEDGRAQSLLQDMSRDPLAKEIIDRVDDSPYGVKGRNRDLKGSHLKPRHAQTSGGSALVVKVEEVANNDMKATHPSNDWQDRVLGLLGSATRTGTSTSSRDSSRTRETLPTLITSGASSNKSDSSHSPSRRQRRRIDDHLHSATSSPSIQFGDGHFPSPISIPPGSAHLYATTDSPANSINDSVNESQTYTSSDDEDLVGAVGQLSLNEDEEVRYHGKASGLHLLGDDRLDRRNEGGIWRFPKARVWPPLPPGTIERQTTIVPQLPPLAIQEHLIDLYFTHVHPSLPVIHKQAFSEAFHARNNVDGNSPASDIHSDSSATLIKRKKPLPAILLFAMFAIAARYSDHPSNPPPPDDSSTMWEAGDDYLNQAKVVLDSTYASSRPSTCQALLLMGYREIGIGAMAQAWTYTGMAIRMAQDLGMHRKADGWARAGLGGKIFGEWELNERRRIWYSCVIMDKYVSTYIGRPLSIFDKDFDTLLPSEDDPEELEEWKHPAGLRVQEPIAGRVISCFNAAATLSGILGMIVQSIYAVRPGFGQQSDYSTLERALDRWYLELPRHLQHEVGSKSPVPLPSVLVLHMQYWCTVLLLHRPSIRLEHEKNKRASLNSDDSEIRTISGRSYELSSGAANHLTAIVKLYSEHYPIDRCAVFLCYYVFTASLMHVTTLCAFPSDPQAMVGLSKCMGILEMMETVWPSAGRALELLRGSSVHLNGINLASLTNGSVRRKRSAQYSLDESEERLAHPTSLSYSSVYLDQSERYPDPSQPQQAGMSFAIPYWTNAAPFSNPMSTSALPQVYSTGLVDDQRSMYGNTSMPQGNIQGGRFSNPTYWNDYSTYSQLGIPYHSFGELPFSRSAPSYGPDPFQINK